MNIDLGRETVLPEVNPKPLIDVLDRPEFFGGPLTERDLFSQLKAMIDTTSSVTFYSSPDSSPTKETIIEVKYAPEILLIKGADSHLVFGVRVVVKNSDGTEEEIEGVAKKHPDPKNAQGEFDLNRLVLTHGIRTTRPIGYIAQESSFLITKFDKYLLSGDRIAWSDLLQANNRGELQRFFGSLASAVSHLHNIGIYHLDLQLKNTALDKLSGEAFIFDWESAFVLEDKLDERDVQLRLQSLKILLISIYDQSELRSYFFGQFGQIRKHHEVMRKNEAYLNLAERLLFHPYKDQGELLDDFERLLKEQGYDPKEIFSEEGLYAGSPIRIIREGISRKLKSIHGMGLRSIYSKSKRDSKYYEFWWTFEEIFLNGYLRQSNLPEVKQTELIENLQKSLKNKMSGDKQET